MATIKYVFNWQYYVLDKRGHFKAGDYIPV